MTRVQQAPGRSFESLQGRNPRHSARLHISSTSCRRTGRSGPSSRTAVYGPVCTVVWEGRSRKAPPLSRSMARLRPLGRRRRLVSYLGNTGCNAPEESRAIVAPSCASIVEHSRLNSSSAERASKTLFPNCKWHRSRRAGSTRSQHPTAAGVLPRFHPPNTAEISWLPRMMVSRHSRTGWLMARSRSSMTEILALLTLTTMSPLEAAGVTRFTASAKLNLISPGDEGTCAC
jgi:hypothetical protein